MAEGTLQRADRGGSTDFGALNLRTLVAPKVTKDPSGWLSPLWSRLLKEEEKWQEGMADTARREGLAFVPRLEKLPGSPAIYRIQGEPLPTDELIDPAPTVPAGGIYYTPESISAPGAFLSSAMRSGVVRWTAALRWSIMLAVLACLIAVTFMWWLMVAIAGHISRPVSPADVLTVSVLVALAVGLASVFRFFSELFDLRIVMAPSFLTPLGKDNVTLELRPSAGEEDGKLVFARYSSTCPLCSASILLFDGAKDFPGRLVGRCTRSAREHVYSFDPVSKVGRPLREGSD